MKQRRESLHRALVKFFFDILLSNRRHGRSQRRLVSGDVSRKIDAALGLKAVLDLPVKHQAAVKMHQILLICRAVLGGIIPAFLGFCQGLNLRLKLRQLIGEIVVGIVVETGLISAQQALQFGSLDTEDFALIRQFGLGHRFEHPLGGRESVADSANGRFAAHAQQRIAGDGVHRLDAAIEKNGQSPEKGEVKLVLWLGRARAREEPEGEHDKACPRQPLFHKRFSF